MFDSNVFELQNNVMSDFNKKRMIQNPKLNVPQLILKLRKKGKIIYCFNSCHSFFIK